MVPRALALLSLSLLAAAPAVAATVHDESIDGDLADGGAQAPTPLAFSVGSNVVTGVVATGGSIADTRDYWWFTIDPGLRLDAVRLLQYDDPNRAGSTFDGNRGFYSLLDGVSSVIPGGGFANLGGNHLDPLPAGSDLLAPIAAGGISGGDGFSLPLGAGTYTFQVQQTGPQVSAYSLDFVVSQVPEPTAGVLGLLSVIALVARRRVG